MSDPFPPLDTHAHVDVTIPEQALLALRAVVLVATRSLSEHSATLGRVDPLAVWGVGIHPGVPAATAEFNDRLLRQQLRQTSLLSEIGLERRSRVPQREQQRVFAAALDAHDDTACIASVHSAGRTAEVIDMLEGHRCSGVILHWWRGSTEETRAAIELGCYFSFNPCEANRGSILGLIPADRILTETDHPYGDKDIPNPRPGVTASIERQINLIHPQIGRQQIWSNFRRLLDTAGVLERLPTKIVGLAHAAPTRIKSARDSD
jgi:TatD DNase family protein